MLSKGQGWTDRQTDRQPGERERGEVLEVLDIYKGWLYMSSKI